MRKKTNAKKEKKEDKTGWGKKEYLIFWPFPSKAKNIIPTSQNREERSFKKKPSKKGYHKAKQKERKKKRLKSREQKKQKLQTKGVERRKKSIPLPCHFLTTKKPIHTGKRRKER